MFGKIITALVTPFDENLEIDYESFNKLLDHVCKTHSDSVLIGGTTGEGPTLSLKEKINLFNFAKNKLNKKMKIIVAVGTNNTSESIKQVKALNKLNIDFEIVDSESKKNTAVVNNIADSNFNTIIDKLLKIDFDNITFRQAFDILFDISNEAKSIVDTSSLS